MSLFKDFKESIVGFMDEIRCDEPTYLIWKWHPVGTQSGLTKRENAIRWGSPLRVKDGEVAVFVYTQDSGIAQEFIVGPYDDIITTSNLPIIARIIGLAYAGGTPFQAEVYFINLAKIIQIKFGVPFFDVYDPRFPDFCIPVAVRGTISFRISDYQHFIKLHRLSDFNLYDFQKQVRDAVSRYVKQTISAVPLSYGIPVVQLESYINPINGLIEKSVANRFEKDFGVLVSGVDIGAIEIDKSSEEYRQLLVVTKNAMATKVQAETEDYVERLRIQREETQYAMHKKTQTDAIQAFLIEKQAEVGIAGAQALSQMGANAPEDISGRGHFNIAGMMAGMSVGSAVGQNIVGAMNSVANQLTSVPPIPTVSYHVIINGQAVGPFDLSTLSQMASNGQLSASSLVWKPGMAQWTKAGAVVELQNIFTVVSPPISSV